MSKPPASHPASDKVLELWFGPPDADVVREARLCMEAGLPYDAYDRQWRVTYVGPGNEDCFEIEGVEWT